MVQAPRFARARALREAIDRAVTAIALTGLLSRATAWLA